MRLLLCCVTAARASDYAFQKHCGETTCFAADTNGGGKTHAIMKFVGEKQRSGAPLLYRRVPFRESSTSASLVKLRAAHRRQPPERRSS